MSKGRNSRRLLDSAVQGHSGPRQFPACMGRREGRPLIPGPIRPESFSAPAGWRKKPVILRDHAPGRLDLRWALRTRPPRGLPQRAVRWLRIASHSALLKKCCAVCVQRPLAELVFSRKCAERNATCLPHALDLRKRTRSSDTARRARRCDLLPHPLGQLDRIDSEHSLRTVLARIAEHPISRIVDLLAWSLAERRPDHTSQAA